MRCFKLDFNDMIKISLLGKEHLIPPRQHFERRIDTYIMYFITEGELYLENGGEALKLVAGDICLFAKGDYQKPVAATDCKYYYIHFDMRVDILNISESEFTDMVKQKNLSFTQPRRAVFEKYNYMSALIPSITHVAEQVAFERFLNLFKKNAHSFLYSSIENRIDVSFDILKLFLRIEKLAHDAYGKKEHINKATLLTIEKIIDYVEKNFLLDFGSAEIELEFLINFDYANRLFKQMTGKSIIKYRNDLRIECAKHLLLTTSKSVEDIAYESGFRDKFYFSRFFTKCVGVSPRMFREGD